jgi:hypothetical protein
MANLNGTMYGLTILSPIIDDDKAIPSHDLQIRAYLADLPTDCKSPFALAPGTHLCRLVVMDDVIYVGMPACEEHLKSKYLVFESNCDAGPKGDIDGYLTGLAKTVGTQLDAIWSHCVGYPGVADIPAFVRYMKACQLTTSFYFAAVNNRTLPQTLQALQTQRAVADFIAANQGLAPAPVQTAFAAFLQQLDAQPLPLPGGVTVTRDIKTGGKNE